ncbi:hypothetical protein SK128_003725, partial [Halocaridina rubra]
DVTSSGNGRWGILSARLSGFPSNDVVRTSHKIASSPSRESSLTVLCRVKCF